MRIVSSKKLVELKKLHRERLTLTTGDFHVRRFGAEDGWFADCVELIVGSLPLRASADIFSAHVSAFQVCVHTLSILPELFADHRGTRCFRKLPSSL